eukprot:2542686-Alexandrium_andersonii.AAC.1
MGWASNSPESSAAAVAAISWPLGRRKAATSPAASVGMPVARPKFSCATTASTTCAAAGRGGGAAVPRSGARRGVRD